MRDDDVLSDAERQLAAVLRPEEDRARHVGAAALSVRRDVRAPRRSWVVAMALASLMIVAAVVWRASAPAPPALHISGSGSVVVVTTRDGRRWVIHGEREPTVRGGYVIAFPQ